MSAPVRRRKSRIRNANGTSEATCATNALLTERQHYRVDYDEIVHESEVVVHTGRMENGEWRMGGGCLVQLPILHFPFSILTFFFAAFRVAI